MPRWLNQPLIVYHGTDSDSLPPGPRTAGQPVRFAIDVNRCRQTADFGQGFYTTTSAHQAEQWANTRVLRKSTILGLKAVVLMFSIDRSRLAELDTLAFVRPTRDLWDLVWSCRNGFGQYGAGTYRSTSYDVVYGPVTLWPQLLAIADSDQISFHTDDAVAALGSPELHAEAPSYLF